MFLSDCIVFFCFVLKYTFVLTMKLSSFENKVAKTEKNETKTCCQVHNLQKTKSKNTAALAIIEVAQRLAVVCIMLFCPAAVIHGLGCCFLLLIWTIYFSGPNVGSKEFVRPLLERTSCVHRTLSSSLQPNQSPNSRQG